MMRAAGGARWRNERLMQEDNRLLFTRLSEDIELMLGALLVLSDFCMLVEWTLIRRPLPGSLDA